MAPLVFLALLALPFVEIAVFIEVGERIGLWPTVALTLFTSCTGYLLLRRQGLATLMRAREAMARDEPPIEEMLDGLAILLAGALLMVPGFVTDAFGLLLFVPWIRRAMRRRIWTTVEIRERRARGATIETAYTVVEDGAPRDADGAALPAPPRSGDGGRP